MNVFIFEKENKNTSASNLLEKEIKRFADDFGLTIDEVKMILKNAAVRDAQSVVYDKKS